MSHNRKEAPYYRKMVVAFVSGQTGTYTLKGEHEDLEEQSVPYIGDAIKDNEPFHVIAEDTIINPTHVMSVSFGPIKENDGA